MRSVHCSLHKADSNHYSSAMCYHTAPKHPTCGHAAHGTAWESSKLQVCRKASSRKTKCPAPSWQPVDVNRAYCDHCIACGEMLAQSQGLDPGVYCRRMNVSYIDLEAANPGLLSRQSVTTSKPSSFPSCQDLSVAISEIATSRRSEKYKKPA